MNIILCVSIDYNHANDRTYREYRYMVYIHTRIWVYRCNGVYKGWTGAKRFCT